MSDVQRGLVEEGQMNDKPTCASEVEIRDPDDSLDAQISLLESTLTETNECVGLEVLVNPTNDEFLMCSSNKDFEATSVKLLNEDVSGSALTSKSDIGLNFENIELLHQPLKIHSNSTESIPSQADSNSTRPSTDDDTLSYGPINKQIESDVNCELHIENTGDQNVGPCGPTVLPLSAKSELNVNKDKFNFNEQTSLLKDLSPCPETKNLENKSLVVEAETLDLEKPFAEAICSYQQSESAVGAEEKLEFKGPQVSETKCDAVGSKDATSLDAMLLHNMPEIILSSDVSSNQVDKTKSKVYCSTPINFKHEKDNIISEEIPSIDEFGQITPLNKKNSKPNHKRKLEQLECIEEVDENDSESLTIEKKFKPDQINNEEDLLDLPITDKKNESCLMESETSQTIPCYEAPAKSILKKWQSSNLARTASSSYLVLDECGESDAEESGTACSQHSIENEDVDDFEIACKSLNEELMKCSSQDLSECQVDDKFDALIQEINQTYGLDEKTSLSIKTMEESTEENLSDLDKTITEQDVNQPNSEVVPNLLINILIDKDKSSVTRKITEEGLNFENKPSDFQEKDFDKINLVKEETNNEPIINDEKVEYDEEDFLLNEKKKPYEYVDFKSDNNEENIDNYNPEWEKLGKLTSDEQRYKAVRDRWRSLVPPDPNRNCTVRQWRRRNNKPPLRIQNNNNNHRFMEDGEKTLRCTAMYDCKIRKLQHELKEEIHRIKESMNDKLYKLGFRQEAQQNALLRRGGSGLDFARLHHIHIEECQKLKAEHQIKHLERKNTFECKINKLREASDEVLLFQQFYRGVGSQMDGEACYLSEEQVEELKETDDMLDMYPKFYRG